LAAWSSDHYPEFTDLFSSFAPEPSCQTIALSFDRETIRALLESPFTQNYYAKAGIDVNGLMMPYPDRKLSDLRVDPAWYSLYNINTDLFPKDEYGR